MEESTRQQKLNRIAMLAFKYGIRFYGISDIDGERTIKAECVFCGAAAERVDMIIHHHLCLFPLAREIEED